MPHIQIDGLANLILTDENELININYRKENHTNSRIKIFETKTDYIVRFTKKENYIASYSSYVCHFFYL